MSSLGTGRAHAEAMRRYREACKRRPQDKAECDRLYAEAWRAYDIHQDYLQAERDDARRDEEEQ